jgi:hypothetical protein
MSLIVIDIMGFDEEINTLLDDAELEKQKLAERRPRLDEIPQPTLQIVEVTT